jgi:hypothetical protein
MHPQCLDELVDPCCCVHDSNVHHQCSYAQRFCAHDSADQARPPGVPKTSRPNAAARYGGTDKADGQRDLALAPSADGAPYFRKAMQAAIAFAKNCMYIPIRAFISRLTSVRLTGRIGSSFSCKRSDLLLFWLLSPDSVISPRSAREDNRPVSVAAKL